MWSLEETLPAVGVVRGQHFTTQTRSLPPSSVEAAPGQGPDGHIPTAGPMISHFPHALVPWHLRPPSGCAPFSLAPATEEQQPVKHTQDDKWTAAPRGGEGVPRPWGVLERAPKSLRQQMRVQTMLVKARKWSALRP